MTVMKLPDYVWCHVHGCVHEDNTNPFDESEPSCRWDDYNGPVDEQKSAARTELYERIKTAAEWSPGRRSACAHQGSRPWRSSSGRRGPS